MAHRGTILRLTRVMERERATVATIHVEELPDSGLSVLGVPFLYHFYYGVLLDDPSYYCYAYVVDGEVAGFVAFSTDSRAVCRRAGLGSPLLLAWTLGARLIRQPSILADIFKSVRFFDQAKSVAGGDVRAEAMSTAVAKAYRGVDYFRRTGRNVGQELYFTIARVLNGRGIKKVKGFTRRSNVLVNASLSFLGWEKAATVGESHLWTWDTEMAVKKFNLNLLEE